MIVFFLEYGTRKSRFSAFQQESGTRTSRQNITVIHLEESRTRKSRYYCISSRFWNQKI